MLNLHNTLLSLSIMEKQEQQKQNEFRIQNVFLVLTVCALNNFGLMFA